MSKNETIDQKMVKAFASAAIRTIKQQCGAKIEVGLAKFRPTVLPMIVDIASCIELNIKNFKGTLIMCYPKSTFLGLVRAMTGTTHLLIGEQAQDGAAELLNIIYGEIKSALNSSSDYKLPMVIPKILLADAALEKIFNQDPAIIIPFTTQFGKLFAQIGLTKESNVGLIQTNIGKVEADSFPKETRILVVDDMSTMRKFLHRSLNTLGYVQVNEADDGISAWEEILKAHNSKKPYQLIFSDWNMPGMMGIDLLKYLKADMSIRNTPFILVTAESEQNQILEAAKLGVDGYVLKPVTMDQLKAKLKEIYQKVFQKKSA